MKMQRSILVAVDDSDASQRAADYVSSFFGGLDVKITALNVGSAPISWGPYPAAPGAVYPWVYPVPTQPWDTTVDERDIRAAGESTVATTGVGADETVVEVGADVAETIRQVAVDRDVDLIVVGSTHRNLFERLFNPSVSAELSRDAPRPVLVVQ